MRTLYYLPMVHTSEECGVPNDGDADYARALAEYWDHAISRMVRWLAIEGAAPPRFHVYLDGLPDGTAADGSRLIYMPPHTDRRERPATHVVHVLWRNGAIVHGTEDPALLAQCRRHRDGGAAGWEESIDRLTAGRDSAIARTIHETLPDGHWGILFIGAGHKTDEELRRVDPALRIVYVCDNPLTGLPATRLPGETP